MISAVLFVCIIVALASSMTQSVTNLRGRGMDSGQEKNSRQSLRRGNEWNLNSPSTSHTFEETIFPSITFIPYQCETNSSSYFSPNVFRMFFNAIGRKQVTFSGPRYSSFDVKLVYNGEIVASTPGQVTEFYDLSFDGNDPSVKYVDAYVSGFLYQFYMSPC
jgi:hypothetical protein